MVNLPVTRYSLVHLRHLVQGALQPRVS